MKAKLMLLYVAAIFSLGVNAAGSKLTLEDVNSVYVRSSGPILKNNEVTGYFFFYETDKIDRKTRQYILKITDEFLNPVKEVSLVDDAKTTLLESSFDGTNMVFLFYNEADNAFNYRIFGLDGKEKYNYTRELDKKDKQMLAMALAQSKEGTESQFVRGIENNGFVSIIPIRDGKDYSWEMNYYGAATKKQWTYAPDEGSKFTTATILGNTQNMAILQVLQRNKLMSKDNESHMIGINLKNGAKEFDVLPEQDGYRFLPMNAIPLEAENSFIVFGQYYNGDDRVGADQSQGLFIAKVDAKGKVTQKKYLSWQKELSKFVNVSSSGKVEDVGFLYCHKIIPTEDGGFAIVAEGYKRSASALGIASAVLTQSYTSVTKITVTNLVWIQIKPDFNIENVKVYEKNKNNIEVPGADVNSAAALAAYIKAYGGFDYSFTQVDNTNGGLTVGYVDYEKSSEGKGLVFHSISYFNKKVTTDKVSLTTKGAVTYVYPAKPGNIMIMEYVKKQKKLDMRFEKLN